MGSTPFGNAGPIPIGIALPQHIEIDRAGNCRVRVGVAPGWRQAHRPAAPNAV